MDYGCAYATLAGIADRQMDRLQSVLNAAARLIYSARKYDHVSALLAAGAGEDYLSASGTGLSVSTQPRAAIPCR